MNFTFNRNPGILCLALFLLVFALTFFGMAIPPLILGILAFLAGLLLIVTG